MGFNCVKIAKPLQRGSWFVTTKSPGWNAEKGERLTWLYWNPQTPEEHFAENQYFLKSIQIYGVEITRKDSAM